MLVAVRREILVKIGQVFWIQLKVSWPIGLDSLQKQNYDYLKDELFDGVVSTTIDIDAVAFATNMSPGGGDGDTISSEIEGSCVTM